MTSRFTVAWRDNVRRYQSVGRSLCPGRSDAREMLLRERLTTFIYLLPDDIERAWKIFRSHTDKGWSFTDCTSFALMQRLQISTVFAFDKHFAQMRGIRRETI